MCRMSQKNRRNNFFKHAVGAYAVKTVKMKKQWQM